MMVIFLTGLVSVILLRTLRRDFARYDKEEELGDLVGAAEDLLFGLHGFLHGLEYHNLGSRSRRRLWMETSAW
jgi:hypothetical protein